MDKGEMDALDELKSANETITSSLQNDLLVLQGQYKALTTDFEQQKTQLVEALLSKDKALFELSNMREMLTTNDEVLLAKSRAEKKLTGEKTLNELNEVSRHKLGAFEPPNSPRMKFWDIIKSPLRTFAHSPKRHAVRPQSVMDLEAAKLRDVTLARELVAIGAIPLSPSKPLPSQPQAIFPRRRNTESDLD
jgi:hypothetical protein